MNKLEVCRRCDVVFDVYKRESLKSWTRQLRGKGDTLKVESNTKLPKDWSSWQTR